MTITFKCKTNKDYVAVNTLKIGRPYGAMITIDREYTEYSIEDGILTMTWRGCYLWAVDGQNIFGSDGYRITDEYSMDEFKALCNAAMWRDFELEDDVDEDYFVTIDEMEVYL